MISSQHFASGLARFTFLLVASAFSAPSALADTVKAQISTPLPTYQVLSNGSSYHQVQGSIGSAAFSVTADAEVAGQVTSVSYSALARATGAAGGPFVFTSQADGRTFSGNPAPETAAPESKPRAVPVPAPRSTPNRRASVPEPATEADPPATPESRQQPQSGLLQHELTHTTQQGAGASPSRGGVQLQQRPSPANSALPEVDDEVLAALESGSFNVSGKYVVVTVRHRQAVRLREGAYRSKSGRTFRIASGRFIAGD